jgi:hypothetical protein
MFWGLVVYATPNENIEYEYRVNALVLDAEMSVHNVSWPDRNTVYPAVCSLFSTGVFCVFETLVTQNLYFFHIFTVSKQNKM